VTREVWEARYPDLAGKTAILAGASSALAEVGRCLCRHGAMPAVVAEDRELVASVTSHADGIGAKSFGIVAEPGSRETWARVAPHIEQRLGPIDIVVVVAPPDIRQAVITALMPDMSVRRRGVIAEAGERVDPLTLPAGLRHRSISGATSVEPADLANTIAFCVSDLLTAPQVEIRLA
jgi:NAD(P)-dependent dehydrogenase (short-subunit alcohol dehydrogenase family)